jgi:aminoglycoside phosphotransferase
MDTLHNQLPKALKDKIQDKPYVKDDMGLSSSAVYVFDEMVLKMDHNNTEFTKEIEVLKFLKDKLPVPKVLFELTEHDQTYLLMERIHGHMLSDEVFTHHPTLLVECLADGLKKLWEVPIHDCPFDESIAHKLEIATNYVKTNQVNMDDWDQSFNDFQSPEALLEYLIEHQPIEDQVFSHGDYCLPNLLYDGNHLKGMIDLGRAGISSKWQDISLAVRSLQYNLGSDHYTALFFEKLGIEPNHELIRYYMLVDELY